MPSQKLKIEQERSCPFPCRGRQITVMNHDPFDKKRDQNRLDILPYNNILFY